jgi:hypothetical protein
MSFRKEEKLKIDKNKLINLLEWMDTNQAHKLFDSRIVSSTYLDNDNLGMFKDSEEGSVPRKKIRVRSYSKDKHTKENSSLEIKTSSVEGRYKTSTKAFNLKKALKIGLFDSDYGICKPKVRVTYRRSYYKIHSVRLTIDQDIKYAKINSNGQSIYIHNDTDIIVEIKANNEVPIEYLFKMFPFERIRFSKYSRAINYCLSGNLKNSINSVNK